MSEDEIDVNIVDKVLKKLNITDETIRSAIMDDLKKLGEEIPEEIFTNMTVDTFSTLVKSVLVLKNNKLSISKYLLKDVEEIITREIEKANKVIGETSSPEEIRRVYQNVLANIMNQLQTVPIAKVSSSMFRPVSQLTLGIDIATGVGINRILGEIIKRYNPVLRGFESLHVLYLPVPEREAENVINSFSQNSLIADINGNSAFKRVHPLLTPYEFFIRSTITPVSAFKVTLENAIVNSAGTTVNTRGVNANEIIDRITRDIASIKHETNNPALKIRSEISVLNDVNSFFIPLILPLMTNNIDSTLVHIYKIIPQSLVSMSAEMIKPVYLWLKLLSAVEMFSSNYLINLFFVDSLDDPNSILPPIYLNFIDQTMGIRTLRQGNTYTNIQLNLSGGKANRNVFVGLTNALPISDSEFMQGRIANIVGNSVFNLLGKVDDSIVDVSGLEIKAIEVILASSSPINWQDEINTIENITKLRINDFFKGRKKNIPRLYTLFEKLPDSFDTTYVFLRLIIDSEKLVEKIFNEYISGMSFSDFELLILALNRILEPYQSKPTVKKYFEKLRSVLDTVQGSFKG